jgi:LPS export ABC transporter protein LptC
MTPFFRKHWPLVGIALLLLVAALYIFGTPESSEDGAGFTEMVLEKGVDLTKNITITQENRDKGIKWVLDAKEIKFSDNKAAYSGTDFRVRLELEDGARIKLEGEKFDYDRGSGEITLQGNVNGEMEDGYRFITDHLLYTEERGSIETDAPVKIFGPIFSVSGQGLDFNLEEGDLRILTDVTAHIDLSRQNYEDNEK